MTAYIHVETRGFNTIAWTSNSWGFHINLKDSTYQRYRSDWKILSQTVMVDNITNQNNVIMAQI